MIPDNKAYPFEISDLISAFCIKIFITNAVNIIASKKSTTS
jgi:hypothetical protein